MESTLHDLPDYRSETKKCIVASVSEQRTPSSHRELKKKGCVSSGYLLQFQSADGKYSLDV